MSFIFFHLVPDRFDRFDRKTLAPKIRLAASYSLQAPIVVPCLTLSRRRGTPTSPKISWVIAREKEHMRLIRKSWQMENTKTWEISEMLFRLQIHSLLISFTSWQHWLFSNVCWMIPLKALQHARENLPEWALHCDGLSPDTVLSSSSL